MKVRKADELEELLARKYSSFLCRRADKFRVLRRQPIEVHKGHEIIIQKSCCADCY